MCGRNVDKGQIKTRQKETYTEKEFIENINTERVKWTEEQTNLNTNKTGIWKRVVKCV